MIDEGRFHYMILKKINDLNFSKCNGLIPVIVQDYKSLKVLTLAYVNREAIQKTIDTGYAHFFRRSFKKVMKKGETSGNIQRIKDILVDCDRDSILYLVESQGPACHLEKTTCFHNILRRKTES
jgi:phosphoribosyl-AMP cyclohydrolase